MESLLSIIIPCFNSESTLEETLQSIINQTFSNWETIIINDGSTDKTEEIALKYAAKDERIKYFLKSNEGLGKARNDGIRRSEGRFILPLDSDNLVKPDFAENAIKVFNEIPAVGVVHGNAEFIGEKSGIWQIQEFNLEKLLEQNYIDACAIYKKDHWKEVGGYDEDMPFQGNEDWELWLAFGEKGVVFHKLELVCFSYRVRRSSMLRAYTSEIRKANENYISKKYSSLYSEYYKKYRTKLLNFENQPLKTAKYFIKRWAILKFKK